MVGKGETYMIATTSLQKKKTPIIRSINNIYKYRVLLLFLLPGLAVMIINCYIPMVGVIAAFENVNNAKGLLGSPFVGFKNFAFLFATSDVLRVTRNTVLFNLAFIFIGLVINVFVAICLNELHSKRLSKIFQSIYMLPFFMSAVVVAYALYGFISPAYGNFNKVLFPTLGIQNIDWYMQPKYWVIILPLVQFWCGTGVGSVIYLATITGIDSQLFEAAYVDGANRLQQIRYITLPMLRVTMIIMTILNLGSIIRGNFGLFYQVTMNSAALYPVTDVLDTYIYRSLSRGVNLGMVTAANFYQSAIGCIVVVIANLIVRRIDADSSLF
jgi:putative aldouronate transport system permease protein